MSTKIDKIFYQQTKIKQHICNGILQKTIQITKNGKYMLIFCQNSIIGAKKNKQLL